MSVLPVGFGSAVAGGYQIQRSLRFSSAKSSYLNRTPASAGSRTTWTMSFWIKFSAGGVGYILGVPGTISPRMQFYYYGLSDGRLEWYQNNSGSADVFYLLPAQVFRDPSAWYHMVIVADTTQATPSNRLKWYVNGSQITAFTTSTYPAQNTLTEWNAAAIHNIGRFPSGVSYVNSYLAEVNFIDGQALTPSSFGETDSATGVWKPKAYSGTYGTNGFFLPFKTANNWSGFFDGIGDYLTVPHNSALSPTGDFTIEFWAYTGSTALQEWVTKGLGIQIYNNSSNWYVALSSSNNSTYFINASFGAQTTNTWQHIAISRQGNTYRGFVNGVATTVGTSSSTPSTGTDSVFIGVNGVGTAYYVNGYISNVRIVNGTAVYTGNFTVPTAQLTAITNTSLLTCQSSTFVDNSTNGFTVTSFGDARPQQFSPFTLDVTDDHSGQGNNWQPNNLDLRTTGVGADILVDSPTPYGTDTGVGGEVRGNYCTWNPLVPGWSASLSTYPEGNLSIYGNNTQRAIGTQQFPTTGKWYFEIQNISYGTSGSAAIGVTTSPSDPTVTTAALYQTDGTRYLNGSSTAYGATWGSPSGNTDVIGIAVNNDAGTITFYKNNTSQGAITHNLGNILYPVVGKFGVNAGYITVNFGQRAFAYTAPSGFKALCTQNLTYTHTIGATSTTQANKYFDATTYSGNSSTQSVVNSGAFQPDLVWIKSRSGILAHYLNDSVRGAYKTLFSNLTNAEYDGTSNSDGVSAFNANGFTLLNGTNVANYNASGSTYVGWQWNAGGSNQTISVGQYSTSPNVPSIASTVRANTTSRFSIVTYTGDGTNNATVGHGLGVAPAMIIIKDRNTNSNANNWFVWHKSLSTDNNIQLNTTTAQYTLTGTFGGPTQSASPTNTFKLYGSLGSTNVNESGDLFVAYCFAEVAGYSAFGSYTGNGSNTDGPFVYTGFRPRWIMIKSIGESGGWTIMDTKRLGYNPNNSTLYAEATTVEQGYLPADILSNGFKIRLLSTGTSFNTFNIGYIYAAFAESPFKYSLAR